MIVANQTDTRLRNEDRAALETLASGTTTVAGYVDPVLLGAAKAEIIRRDREYAEQQEQSRRAYEDQREAGRFRIGPSPAGHRLLPTEAVMSTLRD